MTRIGSVSNSQTNQENRTSPETSNQPQSSNDADVDAFENSQKQNPHGLDGWYYPRSPLGDVREVSPDVFEIQVASDTGGPARTYRYKVERDERGRVVSSQWLDVAERPDFVWRPKVDDT